MLLDAALDTIAGEGVHALNLRALARACGVSHAAPAHHFGDRTGLLTAIAAEGYRGLAEVTAETWTTTSSFLEMGVTYVRYAVDHPGHFRVMFRPDLVDTADPTLEVASAAASAMLFGPVGSVSAAAKEDGQARLVAGTAAWALVHGIATLWLDGSLRDGPFSDPEALTRAAAGHLFGPDPGS